MGLRPCYTSTTRGEHHTMGQPSGIFGVALIAFALGGAAAFLRLGPRRGALATLLVGTLFLPVFGPAAGVPLLRTKSMFIAGVALALSAALDARRWSRLRLQAIDLPVLLYCAAPFAAAVANGLGAYDGASATFAAALEVGGPYLLGRLYLGDREGLADFAGALVAAGLVYVPLCLWEIRMSPQLHLQLYGFSPTALFNQNVRFGGYRPIVFMNHGLMVALFMASATVVAYWLWRTGARRALAGLPMGAAAAVLALTTVLCKSTGAVALLLVGVAALEGTRRLRTPALILLLAALPPAYCTARLAGWDGAALVAASTEVAGAERAQSVEFRFRNEAALGARALERPWLGWGRWGRSRVRDDSGRDTSITDSRWIGTLGENGLVGLAALGLVLGLPALALLRAAPARRWADEGVAPAAALAVVGLMGLLDDLLNTMTTPLAFAIAGALAALWGATATAAATPTPEARPTPAAGGAGWRLAGSTAPAARVRQVRGWRDGR